MPQRPTSVSSRDIETAEADETDSMAPPPSQQHTASYIADLTTELSQLARTSGLDILAYLLDIAQLEASSTARRHMPGPGRR